MKIIREKNIYVNICDYTRTRGIKLLIAWDF